MSYANVQSNRNIFISKRVTALQNQISIYLYAEIHTHYIYMYTIFKRGWLLVSGVHDLKIILNCS